MGFAAIPLVREGHPTQQIAAAVRQFHVDRVLLGTRSRGKLGRLLIGSVAEQVLRSVYLPVMTVGPEAHLPVDRGEERVVLHATTLRETSRPSAALACQVAAAQKAKLILLHVLPSISEMERKGLPAGMRSSAMLELRILAAQTGADCCSAIEPVVAHGNPTIEILALAAERRASLIVLSATRRPAFEDITRDRTVYRVLAHARCPVLTLREQQTMPEETARPRRQRPSLATCGGSSVLERARRKACLFKAASFYAGSYAASLPEDSAPCRRARSLADLCEERRVNGCNRFRHRSLR